MCSVKLNQWTLAWTSFSKACVHLPDLSANVNMGETRHNAWLISLHILAVIFYAVELVFSTLNGSGNSELFNSTQPNLSALYKLDITPSSWTFSIWGFIFSWQAVWLVYAVTLLFRKGKNGRLYVDPQILPPSFFIAFCVSCSLVVTWLFVWDRQLIAPAFVALVLTSVALHTAQVFGYRQLNKVEDSLRSQGLTVDVWLTKILVLNGLAFYTTWVSIASCLNFAHVMAYTGPYPLPLTAASSGALALLMVVIFFWFILKTFLFEKALRYILSPFIVLVVALTGSLTKNWNRNNGNSIFTVALLTLVAILLFITVIRVIIKQRQDNQRQTIVTKDEKHIQEPDV